MSYFEIKAAIHDVVVRYCRGVDRGDWELVRSCYFPDARDEHLGWSGSVDEFIEYAREGASKQLVMNHCAFNHSVVLHDASTAGSETYTVAYHRSRQDNGTLLDMTLGVRYLDRFELRDDEWRIAHRWVIGDWARKDLVSEGSMFGEGSVLGSRGDDDLSYELLPKGVHGTIDG